MNSRNILFTKNLQFNQIKKLALFSCIWYNYKAVGIWLRSWYAMKRKVAVGMTGNFRGVCPILNRAIVITNTVCDLNWVWYACFVHVQGRSKPVLCYEVWKLYVLQTFLVWWRRKHTAKCYELKTMPPANSIRRRKKWLKRKRSELRSRVMNTL